MEISFAHAMPALLAIGPALINGAIPRDPTKGPRRMILGTVGTLALMIALLYMWSCVNGMQAEITKLQALLPKK